MSIGLVTLLNISASATLAIFAAALALVVMVQDARRRSNHYFAVCMGIFSLFGVLNILWQVPQQFELEPRPLLYTLTTLYVAGLILLVNFITSFARLPRRLRWYERAISVPVWLVFVYLLWTDRIFTDFAPLSTGSYEYSVTGAGTLGAGLIIVYQLSAIALLVHKHSTKAREIAVVMGVLAVGVAGFAVLPAVRTYTLVTGALTVAIVLLGRLVLKYQVFQPLADLNAELLAKNEELDKATRMKTQFLANMSHELRTPLNSIIGYAELVLTGIYGSLNELQEDRLRKVMRNGRLLLELINDVLDLSKIEAGRLNLTCTHVPTLDLLDSLLHEYESQAINKGLMLIRGYSQLPDLWGDENRVRQILSNLLSNAVKFTEKGVVIVRGHFDIARQQVVISITDTGIGIAPEHQAIIFKAFQQVDGSLTRRYEGTGLGLAIASRLSELHGGCLWFESLVGQGTTFHVALPAVEDLYQPVPILEPKLRARGPVILCLDDDFEELERLQTALEPHHFRVYGASNVNDGLRLAHDLEPALITLNLELPDISGWQVLEVLHRDPATAAIPVLITAASDSGNLAQLTGANGVLIKPVRPAALLDQVRRMVPTQQEIKA